MPSPRRLACLFSLVAAAIPAVFAVSSQSYTWKNVKIGGGGGFVPNIVFNPSQKGLAYARTDIGGAYKLNSDDTWTPLLDFANDTTWNYWGVDALATDPVDPTRLYLATGMYTNSWDPNNGQILISKDQGKTFTASPLSFKVGGNMPGRGVGERLVVDPNSNSILFFGARSGNGLWTSKNSGVTWTKVSGLPNTGTYVPDPTDTSGYNSDKIGIAWVTFDPSSGSSGSATPRIFVGVVSNGTSNIFVTTDAGSSWSAVPGQNTTYFPHKGVYSPAEKSLYVSYSDGAGPYDGTLGAIFKYNISSSTWSNITPVSGGDLYFGFGGVAVDLQKPGTVMVAALNSWYPDGQVYRSTDGGTTWKALWTWGSYPTLYKGYTYDDTLAPWLGVGYTDVTPGDKQIGWMMEGMSIDPFDSDHWLYGTGATIQGGHDLTKWDSTGNITLKSLADGIEETAVLGLISPPTGPSLISAVGDIGGFVHTNLAKAPATEFTNPTWASTADVDFAGNAPTNIVRTGTATDGSSKQVALSTDSGNTWTPHSGAADGVAGSKVALSADGTTVLWRTSSNGVQVSSNQATFTAVSGLPAGAAIAADRKISTTFYGASGAAFYVSQDSGKTFTATAGTLGSSTSPVKIAVHPNVTGDVWVSTDTGLFHSTDTGKTFTAVSGITQAWAIALGAPATSGGYPSVYAAAKLSGAVGYYRLDNGGTTWLQINDAAHGFGSASSNVLTADPRIYGRVYIGTNGRGIFYGDTSGTTTTTTSSSSATSTPVSTTSKPVTTTSSTTTSTSSAPVATQSQYGQCGGQSYSGPTACPTGWTCTVSNPYYSQCLSG
ncbi:carbohydrate-binding module family 1 protein [Auriscalpium vulgare]|uniref:Carbohydrate-binding module family 1 protein n=1 Tax=Auriscalpium vulgare TaxID=40419 RepID=A0ACB8RIV9_9AGAM|nr:carbohydrate-binding module family 1 protein [Auriscalpium vulgare]